MSVNFEIGWDLSSEELGEAGIRSETAATVRLRLHLEGDWHTKQGCTT
jgi:hypothetical protein